MEITRPYNNEIIIVKNLGTKEENEKLYSSLHSAEDSIWSGGNAVSPSCYYAKTAPSNHFDMSTVPPTVQDINDRAISVFEELFGNGYSYTKFGLITRNFKDGYFLHWDKENDPSIEYGIVYYINNNYDGGEIFYPKLNIEYKPEPGDLIIHPGSLEYMHGVRDVSNGIRYSMNMFAKI